MQLLYNWQWRCTSCGQSEVKLWADFLMAIERRCITMVTSWGIMSVWWRYLVVNLKRWWYTIVVIWSPFFRDGVLHLVIHGFLLRITMRHHMRWQDAFWNGRVVERWRWMRRDELIFFFDLVCLVVWIEIRVVVGVVLSHMGRTVVNGVRGPLQDLWSDGSFFVKWFGKRLVTSVSWGTEQLPRTLRWTSGIVSLVAEVG